MQRIHIRELANHIGKTVLVAGWVNIRRDHGKLIFIDLRDETGLIQAVIKPDNADTHKVAETIRPEWVVEMIGTLNKRPEKMATDEPNGDIELVVSEINILSEAQTPPFEVNEDTSAIGEDLRFQYRYLDLRTKRMQKNIRVRGQVTKFIRDFLTEENFVEIETPILTKSSPEGARDFVVPSRLHPGEFYALPQAPQQYKQLLMASGFERYFQIARCFRDEDPRADRAYGEFTQIDIEMSFITQEDILDLTERMFTKMIKELFPEKKITKSPWPRLSHKEAQEKYGTDKPDLRKNEKDKDELAFAWTLDFPLFTPQSKEDFYHGSGSAKFAPSHHMFTSPHPDDITLLDSDPGKVRGLQHDLVLNGYEVGGGSIRIHNPEIQTKIFELIGFSDEQKKQFAHMLTAFGYGMPPHGGIAPGLDRLLMVILGEPSLREVIAFPKTGEGRDVLIGAPTDISADQLKELGLEIKKSKK